MHLRLWSSLLVVGCILVATDDGFAASHKHKAHKAAAPLPRKAPKKEEPKKAEKVEEVEAVEPDAGASNTKTNDASDSPGLLEIMSRLHPAVVHLPIAWIMLLFLADLGTFVLNRREVLTAGLYLSVLAFLSFGPAIVTGLLRLDNLPQDPAAIAPALVHRNMMYVSCLLCGAIVGLRIWKKNELVGPMRWAYLAMVSLAFALVSYGGHLGGRLVYGDDFLPF